MNEILKYLYETMKVCCWEDIAKEITTKTGEKVSGPDCRNR